MKDKNKFSTKSGMNTKKNSDLLGAAQAGDIEKFNYLLDEGADINALDPVLGTSLHIACKQGDAILVDNIIRYHKATGRVDFTIKTAVRPRSAWQVAVNSGFFEIAEQVDSFAHDIGQYPLPQ